MRHGPSEAIYLETTEEERAALPIYEGELLLRLHGTGCYTAKGSLKRWNRIVENLARETEAACAAAVLCGGGPPRLRLARAWTSLLAHQMHDDLTGTSIPAAYELSLDDLGTAANDFQELLLDAASVVEAGLSSPAPGAPFLVLSTVPQPRRELVEITLDAPVAYRSVVDAAGRRAPVQTSLRPGRNPILLAPLDCAGVELQAIALSEEETGAAASRPALEATDERLESSRYRATFDRRGDLASLYDKGLERELLATPLRLELLPDRSPKYPAWEIRWEDIASPSRGRFADVVSRRVVEDGPLRVAVRIERRCGASRVVETWTLADPELDDMLRCEVELDWRTRHRLLKQAFPLAARNPEARFDDGLAGTRRPLASPALYEVPAQHWAAIEDENGAGGVAIFVDSRHGWDHPDPGTLRLSWIHAPNPGHKFRHQARQDFGHHRFRLALAGISEGAVGRGEVAQLAERFLHRPRPLERLVTPPSGSAAPRRITLLSTASTARLMALKPADESVDLVVRMANPSESALTAALVFPPGARLGEPLDALERELAPVPALPAGEGEIRLDRAGVATRRIRCSAAATRPPSSTPLAIPRNRTVASRQGERVERGFDEKGVCFPLERLPRQITESPVPFDLGPLHDAKGLGWQPQGELLAPAAGFSELWLLAASSGGDSRFGVEDGEGTFEVAAPGWRLPYLVESRWRRGWSGRWRFGGGAFRRAPLVYVSLHLHDRRGNDLPLGRGSLFALRVPVRGPGILLRGAGELRVLAATLSALPARRVADAAPRLLP